MNKRRKLEANTLLKQARVARGWTQRHLAEEVGVEIQTIRSWEHGTRFPSEESRELLCRIFAMTAEQLGLLPIHDIGHPSLEPISPPQDRTTVPTALHLPEEPTSTHLLSRDDINRQRMLQRVRSRWLDGVLNHSLYQATLLTLGLQEQPDAVMNPWHLEVQESDLPSHPLPAGTRITSVYDEAGGELLILGDPGAGKTTLLLELARDLLERANLDPMHPIPVVFNLASWAERRPLFVDWIIEELGGKYQVGRALAQKWMEDDQILPLLDGLDEVAEAHRTACIEAVNSYRQNHGLMPMVICGRNSDYLAQAARLHLRTAVIVQPLTAQQIDDYLSIAGVSLAAMRTALAEDPSLQEMARTPLMLSILAITYHGIPVEDVLTITSPSERRHIVFEKYVERVLLRRGPKRDYTPQQTKRWLRWLAVQMQEHSQTEFYLERIQPNWLPNSRSYRTYRETVTRIVFGLGMVVSSALLACFRGDSAPTTPGLFYWIGGGKGSTILGWMARGLGPGLLGSTALCIIYMLVSTIVTILGDTGRIPTLTKQAIGSALREALRYGLPTGGILAVFSAIVFSHEGLAYGIFRGGEIGLFGSLIVALISALISLLKYQLGPPSVSTKEYKKAQNLKQSRPLRTRLLDASVIGVCGAFGFASLFALQSGSITQLVISYGFIIGFFYATVFGLANGIDIIHPLGVTIKPAEQVTWLWQAVQQGLSTTIKKGASLSTAVLVSVVLVITCISSVFYGPQYGLHYGLIYGLIVSFITWMTSILIGVLITGWSSDVLEAQHLTKPNEGIRRSIRNAIFAALLFGPAGGISSGFIGGLAFGLGGVAGWHILAIGFAVIFGIIFAFHFVMVYGGIACIEHYVLRWYFWRSGSISWNYAHFLDFASERILLRKVGGGYIFIHRLLLEYFSSLPDETR